MGIDIEGKILRDDGTVNWEYLHNLKEIDEDDFHQALSILKHRGIITMNPVGNFFVYHDGFHVDPKISRVGYLGYFTKKEDAREFQKRLHPHGLIAKVEE